MLMVPEGKDDLWSGQLGLGGGVPHPQGVWLGLWWVIEPGSSQGVAMSLSVGTEGQTTPLGVSGALLWVGEAHPWSSFQVSPCTGRGDGAFG